MGKKRKFELFKKKDDLAGLPRPAFDPTGGKTSPVKGRRPVLRCLEFK